MMKPTDEKELAEYHRKVRELLREIVREGEEIPSNAEFRLGLPRPPTADEIEYGRQLMAKKEP